MVKENEFLFKFIGHMCETRSVLLALQQEK